MHIRQSAGNPLYCYSTKIDNNKKEWGSSETTRENLYIDHKYKTISNHQPKHHKPFNDTQFGHY